MDLRPNFYLRSLRNLSFVAFIQILYVSFIGALPWDNPDDIEDSDEWR